MHITESLLYSRDWHDIVNQLYFSKKKSGLADFRNTSNVDS